MPCAKLFPSMTVNVALCGSIPRSLIFGNGRASPAEVDVRNLGVQGETDAGDGNGVASARLKARDPHKNHNGNTDEVDEIFRRAQVLAVKSPKTQTSEISTDVQFCKINRSQISTTGTIRTISTRGEEPAASISKIKQENTSTIQFSQNVSFSDCCTTQTGHQKLSNMGAHDNIVRQISSSSSNSFPRGEFVVPSWAVPAAGESRLEPVCQATDTHLATDLTHQPVYYIGRSPTNDVTLFHRTSSRRHALIFHHPCGACYLVDCQSAHGTYLNGNRIAPLVPCRMKRGSLVRFGGPGAPAFILKSFSSDFHRMVRDLGGVARAFGNEPAASKEVVMLEQQAKTNGVACIRGDGGMACIIDEEDAPAAALVLLNTRLNACGGIDALGPSVSHLARRVSDDFMDEVYQRSGRKRSRDVDSYEPPAKKIRIPSILVPRSRTAPAVDEPVDAVAQTTLMNVWRKRVVFSDEEPHSLFPPSVTPDDLSSDSECDEEEHLVLQPLLATGSTS